LTIFGGFYDGHFSDGKWGQSAAGAGSVDHLEGGRGEDGYTNIFPISSNATVSYP